MVVIPAHWGDLPSLVQRVDETLFTEVSVGVDHLEHRDDVGDLYIAISLTARSLGHFLASYETALLTRA
jgi:hypothetical protein